MSGVPQEGTCFDLMPRGGLLCLWQDGASGASVPRPQVPVWGTPGGACVRGLSRVRRPCCSGPSGVVWEGDGQGP